MRTDACFSPTIHIGCNHFGIYSKEVAKHKGILTNEDQLYYGRLSKNGDIRAQNHIINSCLRFVIRIARKYEPVAIMWTGNNEALTDLIGEGNTGLISGVKTWDPDKGKLFVHLTFHIRKSIWQYLYENARLVRRPLYFEVDVFKMSRVINTLIKKLEREPSDEELASAMDMTMRETWERLNFAKTHLSLDMPRNDKSNSPIMDTMASPKENAMDEIPMLDRLRMRMSEELSKLDMTERERKIMDLRFGLAGKHSLTLKETGEEFNLTDERVRQIQSKILKKWRPDFEFKKYSLAVYNNKTGFKSPTSRNDGQQNTEDPSVELERLLAENNIPKPSVN